MVVWIWFNTYLIVEPGPKTRVRRAIHRLQNWRKKKDIISSQNYLESIQSSILQERRTGVPSFGSCFDLYFHLPILQSFLLNCFLLYLNKGTPHR